VTPADLPPLAWAKRDGLLPAIVQHAETGAVLMLGYMNEVALTQTFESRRVTFFSRSRRVLWTKGETSGNFLALVGVSADCDGDALLVQALPAGPVCHAGTPSCFADALPTTDEPLAFLRALERVIADRIATAAAGSYTSRLNAEGPQRIARKLGEEGLELALALAGEGTDRVLSEAADLVFHLLLALQTREKSLADVVAELKRRAGPPRGGEPAQPAAPA